LALCRADLQQDRGVDDAPMTLVLQTTPREEEQQHLDAARTTTGRTTTPPARLHATKPSLTAGKPPSRPFLLL
jgi:hypothetical protein